MSGRPWIKLATTKIDDARLAMCSDAAQRDYLMLYMLAGRLDADGLFIENGRQLSDDEIAFKIRVKASRLKASIGEMKKSRLIHVNGKGPQIVDWKIEQPDNDRKREQTRERVARYRERVTHGNASDEALHEDVTPLEQEQDKSLVVVVVSRVCDEWKELIGDVSPSTKKVVQKFALSGVPEKVLLKAVEITAEQGKDSAAYFKGVVSNLVKGTSKPVKRGGNKTAPAKPKIAGRSIKL